MKTDPTFITALVSAIVSALSAAAIYFNWALDSIALTPVVTMIITALFSGFAAYSRKKNADSRMTTNSADVNPLRLS